MDDRRTAVFPGNSEARTVSPRPRTLLAVALLLGVALMPHCATRPRPAVDSTAGPGAGATSGGEAETTTSSSDMGSDMEASASAAQAPIVPVASDDPFVGAVRPVLSVRCAPCHNPGGKMYARLPFDDAKTVASNSEGILRRLKGDDRAALEKWVAGLAATGAPR